MCRLGFSNKGHLPTCAPLWRGWEAKVFKLQNFRLQSWTWIPEDILHFTVFESTLPASSPKVNWDLIFEKHSLSPTMELTPGEVGSSHSQKRLDKTGSLVSPDLILSFFFFFFLRSHLQHMEVPRLEGKSELQLLAYTTATATRDPSRICNLQHSSRQHQMLNPLSKARDPTCILTDTMSGSQPAKPQQKLPRSYSFKPAKCRQSIVC